MHPQLSDKRITCREFIQALDACHTSNWKRLTGGCNEEKMALNKCLRKEAKRRRKTEQAWKELHADD
ncbi:hypothetical protein BU15DRAFT_90732 [Melanogaster broomeanus]|nr:hypothetical protein BU15DRAFT_90732 [Melanogaster broomeanus]